MYIDCLFYYYKQKFTKNNIYLLLEHEDQEYIVEQVSHEDNINIYIIIYYIYNDQ